ncbi:hypothetical protein AMTRI_Chr05g70710 [Amborella trichopoda]
MKNVTDSVVSLGHCPSSRSFGFNTDIFVTNSINLSVFLWCVDFFRKGGVCELFLSRTGWILPAALYSFSFILDF